MHLKLLHMFRRRRKGKLRKRNQNSRRECESKKRKRNKKISSTHFLRFFLICIVCLIIVSKMCRTFYYRTLRDRCFVHCSDSLLLRLKKKYFSFFSEVRRFFFFLFCRKFLKKIMVEVLRKIELPLKIQTLLFVN
jgi:hypothetical protein